MKVTVNGKQREIDVETVSALLVHLQLDARTVVVELNGGVLKSRDLETARLSEGDKIEVVRFVGGGE
jgi:thiamine biosynthesis protein ThiS